jgi:hypothetical protein
MLWISPAALVGQQIHVGLVYPDRVDDIHSIAEQAEVLDDPYEGALVFFLAEDALYLGFEHVHEKRQVEATAERVEFAEILLRDSLRRRTRDGCAKPAPCAFMPSLEQMPVAIQQAARVHRCRRAGTCQQIGRQEILEEGQLVYFRNVWLIEREGRAHSAVRVGLHDGIDRGVRGGRDEKCVVEHGRYAAFQHLDGAEESRYIRCPWIVTRSIGRRFEQHEHFERQAFKRTLEVIRRRMEMRVDQTGHQKMPGRVDLAHAGTVRIMDGSSRARIHCDDRIVFDRHGGLRQVRVRRIHGEHASAADDGLHVAARHHGRTSSSECGAC